MSNDLVIKPGSTKTFLPSAARTPATPFATNSDDYWMPRSGGMMITVDVTSVAGGGSITAIRLQARHGLSTYVTVIEFVTTITTVGTYTFLIGAGVSSPGSWTGSIVTLPPTQGRLQVQSPDASSITYSVKASGVKG